MSERPLTLLGVPIDSVGKPGGTELGPTRCASASASSGIPDAGDTRTRLRGGVRDPATGWLDFEQVCELTAEVRERVAALVGEGRSPSSWAAAARSSRAPWPAPATPSASAASPTSTATSTSTRATPPRPARPRTSRWRPRSAARPQALLDRLGGDAVVDPERVALLGPRDAEEAVGFGSPTPAEVGIAHYRDRDSLRGADLKTVGADAAERLAEGGRRYWLHLDVDVLDQDAFPGHRRDDAGRASASPS